MEFFGTFGFGPPLLAVVGLNKLFLPSGRPHGTKLFAVLLKLLSAWLVKATFAFRDAFHQNFTGEWEELIGIHRELNTNFAPSF